MDLLLISGAISNSLDKYQPKKLEGTPLILTKNNKVQVFKKNRLHEVQREVKRIHQKKKPTLIQPLLAQLSGSLNIGRDNEGKSLSTLSTVYIMEYLHIQNRAPVLVFWSGSTDLTIVERLRLQGIHMILNITNSRNNLTNTFALELTNMYTKHTYHTKDIGHVEKRGSMLSLLEAHDQICKTKHDITYCHDPIADVILTRCLFNIIIKDMTPKKLYKLCKGNEQNI